MAKLKKIAVIGTGIMGSGIAANFLKNGYQVYVWNRHAKKLKPLQRKGAIVTTSPKEAAQRADIIFEVTADDRSSRSVWLGNNGILTGSHRGSVAITCSTLSLSWVSKLSHLCKTRGLQFFDMGMTGSRRGAEGGTLTLLVGGNEKQLIKLKPVLRPISSNIIYFGRSGSGMKYKLLLNMLQAIHVAALGEVLKVAKVIHLNVKAVGNALSERPGGTTTKMAWRDFQKSPKPINFSVQWIAKDLKYARALAKGHSTLLLDIARKKYAQAIKKGQKGKDWTVITRD